MKTNPYLKRWIFVVLWILFIFANSMLNATTSSAISSNVANSVSFLSSLFNPTDLHLFIRKLAHFIEYAFLGILIAFAIYPLPMIKFKRLKGYSFFLLIPFMDEAIQLFSKGRSAQLSDIIIDLCGGILGFILILFYRKKRSSHE